MHQAKDILMCDKGVTYILLFTTRQLHV